ncbi:MAG: seryl-tRNA synthetase [Oleiphilaceae bacterium]|jgi:seryl-tRNA synthetase
MQTLIRSLDRTLNEHQQNWLIASLSRSFQVNHIDFDNNSISLKVSDDVESTLLESTLTRLLYVSSYLNTSTIFNNQPNRISPKTDPINALLSSGDVINIGKGLFMFQGVFWKLFRYFNNYWRDKALSIGAIEQEYPALWPVDLYKKIDYFSEFPQQVIMASAVKNNNESLNQVATKYRKHEDYESFDMSEHMEHSHFGLQCAVCDICYYALEGSRQYQNSIYTTYNKVFRNESSETNSLDRLTNFSVRDIMFVGDELFVLEHRQKMIGLAQNFLAWLDLDCTISTANDPFFSNDTVMKSVFQNASELKYELLVKLPFSQKEIAIGSINLHQDFFGRAFDIKLTDSTHAWSGCYGIGFERLVYALYAQYGMDYQLWPDHLQKIIKE